MLSKLMQRWGEEFADSHNGNTPVDLTWDKSHEWDREHANTRGLEACEFSSAGIWRAFDLYERGNFAAAFQIWFDLAEEGSVWSMIETGRCYEFGRGVSRNAAEAETWYKRAFTGGSQIAMLKCAKAAAARQDYAACETILKIGVDQDWAPAIFWLAWYRHKQSKSKETYHAIFPLLRRAARCGHPAAKYWLSKFMVRGKFGSLWIPLGFLRAVRFSLEAVRGGS